MVTDGRGRLSLAEIAYDRIGEASLIKALCQPLSAVGLIHASSVIAVVRSSDAASGTVTQSLMPLNDNAVPYFPAVHAAPVMVPVLPVPDTSNTCAPRPSV